MRRIMLIAGLMSGAVWMLLMSTLCAQVLPKVGTPCKRGDSVADSSGRSFSCVDGKWHDVMKEAWENGTIWMSFDSAYPTFIEEVKDGRYTATFTDPHNKWRCYGGANIDDSIIFVCTKPHKVNGEKP